LEYRTTKEVLSLVLSILFYFFALFSPLSFRHEDGDGKVTTCTWADAGVREDVRMFSGPHGVKTVALRPRTSYSSHTTPSTLRDMGTISKMGHMIAVGLPMLRVCHTLFQEKGNEASIHVLKMFKSHVQ
jgi:hypothetical protein